MEDKSSRNRKYSSNSAKDASIKKYQETGNLQMVSSQSNFEKKPRACTSKGKDFKETIQYQDSDSYVSQRHHFLGLGLYNTDEIEDLPPRYRQKVTKYINRLTDVLNFFSKKYPDDFDESKNPAMKDILDLSKPFDITKISKSSADPSKKHTVVEKSNFNENFNRQTGASCKNFNSEREITTNSSNNSRSNSRCDVDFRNDESSYELPESLVKKVSTVMSFLSERYPEDFDSSKNSEIPNFNHPQNRRKHNCNTRNIQSSPHKTSQVSGTSEGCHLPPHSKNTVLPQNQERNSKCSRQNSAQNKNFSHNYETSSMSQDDAESCGDYYVKSACRDLHHSSHSRDIDYMNNEGRNSPNKNFNRRSNAHNRSFSSKEKLFPHNNKSQSRTCNFDTQKDKPFSSSNVSPKFSSSDGNWDQSAHSRDPVHVKIKKKYISSRKFNSENKLLDKNFNDEKEKSNRSYNNLRHNIDVEKYEALPQSLHAKEPVNVQNEPKSNSIKCRKQISSGNTNYYSKQELSHYSRSGDSRTGFDLEKDKPVSLFEGSKHSFKTNNDVESSSCSENLVQFQNEENCYFNKNSRKNSIRDKSNCIEKTFHNSCNISESRCLDNVDIKKNIPFAPQRNAEGSIETVRESHNSSNQKKSLSSSPKSLNHSNETIHNRLKFDTKMTLSARSAHEKDHYLARQNIKKAKEHGFFITVNVSDKSENLEHWIECFRGFLKHNRFSLEFCCSFSESLVLNFERKSDALSAVPILKKKKQSTKNLKDPHLTLVSQLKCNLTRPCDCGDSMFQNCKKYFNDFMEKFVQEHRSKINEVAKEMRNLKNMGNINLHEELKLSLKEKLDVFEKMQTVFKSVVNLLEEKLMLHEKFATKGTLTLKEKYILKDEKFFEFTSQERTALKELLILEEKFNQGRLPLDEKITREDYLNSQVKLPSYSVSFALRKLKKMFSYECNSFRRCLPVYSKKGELLDSIREYSVLIISAETGSGKTTQLAEYLLQSMFADRGTIICTQPRKIAAVSVANFVCGQLGTAVGKLVGYDIGTEKKFDSNTKIIYMTDYALLKKLLRNRKLRGISCVIIDEAHERTLYTDLVLGMLKDCIRERLDLRLIVTSATIDPSLFVQHFGKNQTKVIQVPGRTYPVEVIWLDKVVEVGDNYVEQCVKTALKIHQEEPYGNILIFLTSPGEIDEAILMFKDLCSGSDQPELLCLHGKCELQEQLLVFQEIQNKRKIIFATNAAETSLTIPGIKYVIDSGRAKEMTFYPDKNKSVLLVDFINKSSAEQRKGRAGRTQPGVCYRMYSKKNYEKMEDSPKPEILRTNLQKAVLKLYQFGLNPRTFSFVEPPLQEALKKALESLEHLGLIKENRQEFNLTELGKKVVELPTEPHLAKLILEGIKAEIGYETVIVAALLNEAGRLFFRTEEIKEIADRKKKAFCQENGDMCTYLEVYKRWLEEAKPERYNWCVRNYVNSKALNSATKTTQEILITLHQELGIRVSRHYNNRAFKSQFEKIVFNCFSENLCSYSGHAKLGYFSPHFTDSLFIHPSSSLSYLKTELPCFLVYSSYLQTSRSFLLDVMPIKEETIKQAVHEGTFQLHPDTLKGLQLVPKILGPFGESVLIRYILGKKGKKINNLESLVERLTRCKNFSIDVCIEKGVIVIYLLKKYHETVARYIYEMVEQAHADMKDEEETVELRDSFSFFCLGAGGLISDFIMPGEFKDITVHNLLKLQFKVVEESMKSFGPLHFMQVTDIGKNSCRIFATYKKVASAQKAMLNLSQKKKLKVKAKVHAPVSSEEPLPIYRLEVKWCRSLAAGEGWVEFYSESDCITASGALTLSSFYIGNNYVKFTPSQSEKVLDMKNLPSTVDEQTIEKKLSDKLPDLIKIRNIHIIRKKPPPITEKEVEYLKGELNKLFSSSSMIDFKYPNPSCAFWTALVYFKKWKDGVKALNDLDGKAKIDSVPLQMKVIKESHLHCKAQIYEVIEKEIYNIKVRSKGIKISTKKIKHNIVDIGFSCEGMQELFDTHFEISHLLQAKIINCSNEKYSSLFTSSSEHEIEEIKKQTNTAIFLDSTRKIISIFGAKENRGKAYNEVCSIVTRNILSKKVVFNFSDAPKGFLKHLYSKFGLDLDGLCYQFNLKSAKAKDGKLILEGTCAYLKKAEELLEKICSELYLKNHEKESGEEKEACSDEEKEICAICLDSLPLHFHRLENCGHAFCKACLILQIESKTIPLCCIKENCGKQFYLVDIKKLLSYGSEHTKENFYKAALHYHVTRNPDAVFYCPSPDCYRVHRVSNFQTEQYCNSCKNVICTKCKSFYHYGMSCEFFQKSDGDEEFSFRMWMQEDTKMRKQCPSCRTLIEKDSGCNHLECTNCNSHFCWLCLTVFPTGLDVYDHLPYCSKNQTAEY